MIYLADQMIPLFGDPSNSYPFSRAELVTGGGEKEESANGEERQCLAQYGSPTLT